MALWEHSRALIPFHVGQIICVLKYLSKILSLFTRFWVSEAHTLKSLRIPTLHMSAPALLTSLKDILSFNAALNAGIQGIACNLDSASAAEAMLLLCAGAPCPAWVVPQPSPDEWNVARTRLLSALETFAPNGVASLKRPRESDLAETSAKKPKLIDDADDTPIFTLHSISFTSPVRKKADITVHRATLRLTDPKNPTSNLCDPIPIRKFRHAFIVSTPGKSKPHWTTIALPEDSNDQSVIFGCDAVVTTPQNTTKYPSPAQTHAKGVSMKPLIHSLFAYFPSGPDGLVDLYEPKSADFQSALSNGQSVDAYIGAKDGHLHFFSNGVLWGEKKPCLWFPLTNIVDMHIGVSSGRSFTLYISTKLKSLVSNASLAGNMEGVDDEPLEMHDFSLIDSKEEAPVKKWITNHKQQFAAHPSSDGIPHGAEGSSSAASVNEQNKSFGKAAIGPVRLVDALFNDSDPEDQDFASHSDSDSSNPSSSSSSSGDEQDTDEDGGDGGNQDDSDAQDAEPSQAAVAKRSGGGNSAEELVEDENGLKEYQRISIPAGMKVSAAALEEAQNMMGEAFGIPSSRR